MAERYTVQQIDKGQNKVWDLPFDPTEYKFFYNACSCAYMSFYLLNAGGSDDTHYELRVWKDMSTIKIYRYKSEKGKHTDVMKEDGLAYTGAVPKNNSDLKQILMDKIQLYIP